MTPRCAGTCPFSLAIAADPLLHPPGTDYAYSSYGYNLLSAVIEGASGRDFLRCVRDEVFRPLGMRHTGADHPNSLLSHRAEFYLWGEEGGLVNAPYTANSHKWVSGGLLSTAADLIRFGFGLLAGDLVGPSEVDMLFTSTVTTEGTRPDTPWDGVPGTIGRDGRSYATVGTAWEAARFSCLGPRRGLPLRSSPTLHGPRCSQRKLRR